MEPGPTATISSGLEPALGSIQTRANAAISNRRHLNLIIFTVPAAEDINEHGGTRTPDIQNRNLTLYPTELHAQNQASLGVGCDG